VVKLEHDGISLTTVHAWVFTEISPRTQTVLSTNPVAARVRPLDYIVAVAHIPVVLIRPRA